FAPACSVARSAEAAGTSLLSAAMGTSTGAAPLTLIDSVLPAGAAVWSISSRESPSAGTVRLLEVTALRVPPPSPTPWYEPEQARQNCRCARPDRLVSTDSASYGIGTPDAVGYPYATRISSILSCLKNTGACGPAHVFSTSSLM